MQRKTHTIIAVLGVLALVLAACGGGAAPAVEVTRLVEVTREVQVEVAGTPQVEVKEVPVKFAEAGDTLKTVTNRGKLLCGGNAGVPGFGYLDPATNQFCKAIAAAIFDDSEKIEVIATTGTTRFPALQSGEVDVLIRNTTWTISRDTSLGLDFSPITFYDGQGMMVRKDSGITPWRVWPAERFVFSKALRRRKIWQM